MGRRAGQPIGRIWGVALLLGLAFAGCGRGQEIEPAGAPPDTGTGAPIPPYRVVELSASGAVRGRIEMRSLPPADPTLPMIDRTAPCGVGRRPAAAAHRARSADVVVWLEGVRAGKPLPLERRYELTSVRCELVPRVQAAIAGGMLNVRNTDPTEHETRFVREGVPIAVIRESDAGQVVPTEKVLTQPGLVEVRCAVHPWTQAWIRVFDHPYFTLATPDGTFAIDSVPPGTYRLVAWEPARGVREQLVTVEAGQGAVVTIRY
jgi:hypothetical protein